MAALKIAVVDDDPVALEIVTAFLQAEGFQVEAFVSPAEFLVVVNTVRPDCLVLDVYMPGCSGLDLLTMIGGWEYRAPVVLMSAYGDISLAMAAIKAGAHDFVEKPINPSEFLKAIHSAIRDFRQRAGRNGH